MSSGSPVDRPAALAERRVDQAAAHGVRQVVDRAGPPGPHDQPHLAATYPDARIELDFSTPLELLVATILSAQSTDKRVNLVTPIALRPLSRRRRVRRRRPRGAGGADHADRLLPGQDRHLDQARRSADRALRRRGAADA